MSDIQDEGASTDESDRKSEEGAFVWTKKDAEVARNIEEKTSHSRSQSIDSRHSDSSLQSSSSSGKSTPSSIRHGGVAVTFGITASDTLTPVDNLSGWKITWLSKTYNKVVGLTGLTRRGDFRVRFFSSRLLAQVIDFFGLTEQVPLAAHPDVCLLSRGRWLWPRWREQAHQMPAAMRCFPTPHF
jgi:hypothetical protein